MSLFVVKIVKECFANMMYFADSPTSKECAQVMATQIF